MCKFGNCWTYSLSMLLAIELADIQGQLKLLGVHLAQNPRGRHFRRNIKVVHEDGNSPLAV